jgi:cell wall-associated NlpC family hydrolase
MTDIAHLIGKPYVNGGRGPDAYDCYGLIRLMLAEDGIDIPDYKSPDDPRLVTAIFNSEIRLWSRCEPKRGAVPLFRVPGNFHCAYLLDSSRFIHTWQHSGGICIERLEEWKPRLVAIYEYTG